MTVFVVLHYMASDETIICVDSILNNINGEKKIVIVDNASPNHSLIDLEGRYHDEALVDVIATNENLGFANGNNFGYKYAVENYHPDFIVIMNNDMEIKQSDFISQIEESFSETDFYIMGPDIYSTKKQYHQNPQTRAVPTLEDLKKAHRKLWFKDKFRFFIRLKWWIKGISTQDKNESDQSDTLVTEVVINPLLHGSCYVFSPLFINKHKEDCFYNKTFMYMEAEILYYQAMRDGEKMVYCPFLHVDHHEDVSTDAEFKKQFAKSVFTVKCLLQSTGAFIELMQADGVK